MAPITSASRVILHQLLDAILDASEACERRIEIRDADDFARHAANCDDNLAAYLSGLLDDLRDLDRREIDSIRRFLLGLPAHRRLSAADLIVRAWDILGSLTIGGWFWQFVAERARAAADPFDAFSAQDAIDAIQSSPSEMRRVVRDLLLDENDSSIEGPCGYFRLPWSLASCLRNVDPASKARAGRQRKAAKLRKRMLKIAVAATRDGRPMTGDALVKLLTAEGHEISRAQAYKLLADIRRPR